MLLSSILDAVQQIGIIYILLTLALVALCIDYARMLYYHFKMPPGPIPLPLVGNTLLLPDVKPWIYFEELSHRYNSPIITFFIGRHPTIWLNDAWVTSELLDKRANIYSSRPHMIVFGDLGTGDWNLVTMKYSQRWREHRKITHMGVGMQQVKSYQKFQNDESKLVAYDLLTEPQNYVMHFERYAASVVSIIAYGRRIKSFTDPLITHVIAVMQAAAALNVPGKSMPMLMETFPLLAKLPMARKMVAGRAKGNQFFYFLAKEANDLATQDNFSREIFSLRDQYQLEDREISAISGNLFGAGSDTSASTLCTFVLACVAFPSAVQRAQEELDRVVGPHRSPTFEDQINLPYINAFVKEVLRWRSVAIIGGQTPCPYPRRLLQGLPHPQKHLDPRQRLGHSPQRPGLSRTRCVPP